MPEEGTIAPRSRPSAVVRAQAALTRRALAKMLRRPVDAPVNVGIMARIPLLAPAYGLLEIALMRSRHVDPRVAELARARAATIHGCPW